MVSYDGAEVQCAARGGKVVSIKDRATYQFIRAFAQARRMDSLWLGMNFTSAPPEEDQVILYSDGAVFEFATSYAFDGESSKFGKKDCSFLKRGVAHKPRDTECDSRAQYICKWKRKCCNPRHSYTIIAQDRPVPRTLCCTLQKLTAAPATAALAGRPQTRPPTW